MRVVKVLTDPSTFVRLMTVPTTLTDPSSLATTWVPDGFCCVMVLVMLSLLMRRMRYTRPSLVTVTTWSPGALCCVMLVSADFFEQLTKTTVMMASATTNVRFFILSNQTSCSWRSFASCHPTTKLRHRRHERYDFKRDGHRRLSGALGWAAALLLRETASRELRGLRVD
jgi:hypothetical protein